MRLFKTAEEKAAIKERKARDRFLRSPLGRATTAWERGDPLTQVDFPVDEDGSQTIMQIEEIGWRLDTVGFTYNLRIASTSNGDGQISDVYSSGSLVGVYLFRRP